MRHHIPPHTIAPVLSNPVQQKPSLTILLSHDDTVATISLLSEVLVGAFESEWNNKTLNKSIKTIIFNDTTMAMRRTQNILQKITESASGRIVESVYFSKPSFFRRTLIDGLSSIKFKRAAFFNSPIYMGTINDILSSRAQYFSFFVENYSEEYSAIFFPRRKIEREDILLEEQDDIFREQDDLFLDDQDEIFTVLTTSPNCFS
jgi:hypothetical protein